jgi:hypothetical protein
MEGAKFEIMLRMDYYDVLSYCRADIEANKICNQSYFWNKKAKRDFGVIIENGKTGYFKLFNKIEDSDDICNIDYVDNIVDKILKRIKYSETISEENYKLYFSGEGDSNQNKFEILSNALEIGVIAKTIECASILLKILYAVAIENPLMTIVDIDILKDMEQELTITNFIEQSVENFKMYGDVFNIDDKLTRKLKHFDMDSNKIVETTIEKHLGDVDLWTYNRVASSIKDLIEQTK